MGNWDMISTTTTTTTTTIIIRIIIIIQINRFKNNNNNKNNDAHANLLGPTVKAFVFVSSLSRHEHYACIGKKRNFSTAMGNNQAKHHKQEDTEYFTMTSLPGIGPVAALYFARRAHRLPCELWVRAVQSTNRFD